MKKERIKTFVLVLLIANSLFLTGQIWFREELWSQDYNSFVTLSKIKNVFSKIFTNDEEEHANIEHFFYPRKIVLNDGNNRNVYHYGNSQFIDLNNEINTVFQLFLQNEQVKMQTSTEEEWLNILKGKSFYIDYGVSFNVNVLARFFGGKASDILFQISTIKEFILVPGDLVTNNIMFYIKDSKDNSIRKFLMNYDKSKLLNLIEQFVSKEQLNYTFSFEQKFDKMDPDKPVVLDPEILIPKEFYLPKGVQIKSNNPLNMNNPIHIVESFGYNPNTTRKYTEADNTVVYVENYSRLKIHPTGFIEYTATAENKGLLLPPATADGTKNTTDSQISAKDSTVLSLYESLNRVISHINRVWNNNEYLFISSDVDENANKPGVYKFTFDYYYNGMPIIMEEPLYHAVEVEVENGRLKSYKHYIREYEEYGEHDEEVIPMLLALDNIYKSLAPEQSNIKVDDVFLGFWEKGGNTVLKPKWGIRIGERIITD